MSTADRDFIDDVSGAAVVAPDVAWMARLANEMFKSMPGAPAGLGGGPGALAAAPPAAAPLGALASAPTAAKEAGAPPREGVPSTEPIAAAAVPLQDVTRHFPLGDGLPNLDLAPWISPGGLGLPMTTLGGLPSFYFLDPPPEPPAAAVPPAPRIDPFGFAPSVVPSTGPTGWIFDPASVRGDFPTLGERVHGKPLIWLDNAATTQKPMAVIRRLAEFYEHENSNIHRGAHTLAARATDAYEGARETVRRFLNASSASEIVFTRGATEAINLVAQSFGERYVQPGDDVVVTWLEHHSNIVPWQLLCAKKGARLRVVPVDDRGQVLLDAYESLLGPTTRVVAITQVSNALGTVVPVQQMTEMAHRHGARVLVDGAQAVPHMPVDVRWLDCDWYVFSGHKVFGPTGIGAVYGKREVLELMPPWQGGGNMIADVTFEKTVYHSAPARFEAGTGNIADAVGLGAALDYVMGVGLANIARHEHRLIEYATRKLQEVPGLRIIGTAAEKAGVISFVIGGTSSDEVGKALDAEGIAVRTGHHCAQPALRRFGLESTVRPSFALYNTCDDIDALVAAILQIRRPPS